MTKNPLTRSVSIPDREWFMLGMLSAIEKENKNRNKSATLRRMIRVDFEKSGLKIPDYMN